MYELSVALKYLTPRWRQLSVSIISLISILVIALVVWLIVVFFSVTNGLERSWIQKLVSMTAPMRIIPTDAYYNSYYYQIDSISEASNYTLKSIGEKRSAEIGDPYNPEVDPEVPGQWIKETPFKDPVKELFLILNSVPGLSATDFETTVANLQLRMLKKDKQNQWVESQLSQAAYLSSQDENLLPEDGVLLPKAFKEAGAQIGDKGFLSYYATTMSGIQEQRLPIVVTGFYDPGIIPMGGKFVIANKSAVNTIRNATEMGQAFVSNGINVRFKELNQAEELKTAIQDRLRQTGIDKYWRVETFREYEFTRDLIQQLRSEKNLWTVLASVIILVACSNIVSMLIILVNDKKREIGILRSMGATSLSIALIFGICGVVMGMVGSIIGTIIAIFTLKNLEALVSFVGKMQGYEMFNPVFYGDSLPNQISPEALLFVVVATALTSLIAGIVPAIKASALKPAAILRSE